MTRPQRLALLGCGYAARLNGSALRRLGSAVECFYASREPMRAIEACAQLGGQGVFDS